MFDYAVVIEKYRDERRIAAVCNNALSRNEVPAIIASKGRKYSCTEINYQVRAALNNNGYIVYVMKGKSEDFVDDPRKMHLMYTQQKDVSDVDFFLYKTESSATSKVKELNDKLEKEGLPYEATYFEFQMNIIY